MRAKTSGSRSCHPSNTPPTGSGRADTSNRQHLRQPTQARRRAAAPSVDNTARADPPPPVRPRSLSTRPVALLPEQKALQTPPGRAHGHSQQIRRATVVSAAPQPYYRSRAMTSLRKVTSLQRAAARQHVEPVVHPRDCPAPDGRPYSRLSVRKWDGCPFRIRILVFAPSSIFGLDGVETWHGMIRDKKMEVARLTGDRDEVSLNLQRLLNKFGDRNTMNVNLASGDRYRQRPGK